jgi:hypothetical protein
LPPQKTPWSRGLKQPRFPNEVRREKVMQS